MKFDPDKSLFPTHTCFDDANELLQHFSCEDEEKFFSGFYQLCHGIMLASGVKISHAWIETPTSCYDMKIFKGEKVAVEYPRDMYYKNIVKHTAYTLDQIVEKAKLHGGCGPWEEEYKALCGTDKTMHKLDGTYEASYSQSKY